MKNIEVFIPFQLVNQIYRYLLLAMGERAVFAILTITAFVGVACTKLGFVLIRVVKDLDVVVSIHAAVFIRTRFLPSNVIANLTTVSTQLPAFVSRIVKVRASLLIVVSFSFVWTL